MLLDTRNSEVFIIIVMLLSFSCIKKNDTLISIQSGKISTDSIQVIDTSEYVVFWNKFNKALLHNDTTILSLLIDDDFIGYCNKNIDNSEICKIDFKNDTIISKSRFLNEFSHSLNPIYLKLLRQYEVSKDIKPVITMDDFQKRYLCRKEENESIYAVYTSLIHENRNEIVSFKFCYMNEKLHYGTKVVELEFRKLKTEIKLVGVDFYYFLAADE